MSRLLDAPSVRRLAAGDLEAVFLPERGMLCASLRHRGAELLRRVDDLDGAAAKGSTTGIPLLHPWANRLDGPRYRAASRAVELDPRSSLLHTDANGLPMHGVPWSQLAWNVTSANETTIAAQLDWARPALLAVFPFQHRLELTATLRHDGLSLDATLAATAADPVPVSFGFHPYFGLPDLPREAWRLVLPPMRKLALDARGIPTGGDEAFAGFDAPLGARAFDDGFTGLGDAPSLALAGAGRRIALQFGAGYDHAQVFAPSGQPYVALEPMTAPTNALVSGRGLRVVKPGGSFRAAFRVTVGAA
jgi:aldose 1-epimerase